MQIILNISMSDNNFIPCNKVRGLKVSSKLKALRHKDNTSNTSAKTALFINGLHTFNKQNGFVTEKQYFYIVKLYNSLIENR